jgi:hypothetical protein
MTPTEELLFAAERLAEAVDDFRKLDRYSPPSRTDFDAGQDDEEEFREAAALYAEDREDAKAALVCALRDYRRAQEHELCTQAIRGVNGPSDAAGMGGA